MWESGGRRPRHALQAKVEETRVKEPASIEPTREEPTQKEPHKKQVVKWTRRDARQTSTTIVSKSEAEVPLPLITRLPDRKETLKELAQVPDKLDSLYTIFFILSHFCG